MNRMRPVRGLALAESGCAIGKPDDPRKHYGKMAMAALEPRFAAEPGLVVISPATPGSNGITHESESARAHIM